MGALLSKATVECDVEKKMPCEFLSAKLELTVCAPGSLAEPRRQQPVIPTAILDYPFVYFQRAFGSEGFHCAAVHACARACGRASSK